MFRWSVAVACLAVFAAAAAANGSISLGALGKDEVHDGCGTELRLAGARDSDPEVFDYLDGRPGDIAHVRVNGKLRALRFVALVPVERWRDRDIEAILRTRADSSEDPNADAARLDGTLTIRFRNSARTRTWRVQGWVGC